MNESQDLEPEIKRRGGRPRLADEPMTTVSMRLPVSMHDRLIRIASRSETSVSDVARKLVILSLPPSGQ